MPNKAKTDAVARIKETIGRSKSIFVTDYRGITVGEMTVLRNRLRAEGIEYKVVKNRLAKIALRESGLNTMDEFLTGTKAVAFGIKDPIAPAKVLVAYSKENDKLKVLGGLMDNQILTVSAINELSQMPSREVLLSRMIGSLSGPVQKLAYGLNQTVAKLAYAIDAVARKKAEQGA